MIAGRFETNVCILSVCRLPPEANGKPTDWNDASHLRRTRLDLTLGVPFVLLFALPLVGYAAPLFAVLAPRYIPSTFHTSAHVGTFLREDARAGRQVLKRMLEQYGFHGQACSLSKFRELIRRIERGHGQVESLTDLVDLAGIMHTLTPNIASLSRTHLRQLHQSLTHSSFVAQKLYTAKMLARALQRWRDTIWEDDQLLWAYGVDRLTTAQVVEALYSRGIYRHPLAMAYILQRTQHRALQSVDSATPGADDLTKPDPLLAPAPNKPTAAVVQDWKRTLQQWVEMHRTVEAEAARRKLIEEEKAKATAAEKATAAAAKRAEQAATPTTTSSTPRIHAAASATASVPSLTAESAPSSNNIAAASAPAASTKLSDVFAPRSTGPAPLPPVFPMAFVLHVPALARAPQTIAPTDTPLPIPQPPKGETPEQQDAKMLNEAVIGESRATSG